MQVPIQGKNLVFIEIYFYVWKFFNLIPLHGSGRLIRRETKLKYAALGRAGSYSFSTISLSKKQFILINFKIR